MRLKGVTYDVGVVMGFNWRPDFEPALVRRELEIIHRDLHCTGVRVCGRDLNRVIVASDIALTEGLEVWVSPLLWDRSPDRTLAYIGRAAARAWGLHDRAPGKAVLCVGGELTLFMRGILPGRSLVDRLRDPRTLSEVRAGHHNAPLNAFLRRASEQTRKLFPGPISYASLVWEAVDWERFDYVGVDHYRTAEMGDRYVEMLRPSLAVGKPVVVTEFGFASCAEGIGSRGFLGSAGIGPGLVDDRSLFLHHAPLIGRWIRPRMNGLHRRDEGWQARNLVDQLEVLDRAGVDGAFVSQFIAPSWPYDPDPRYDLDMASTSLVRSYEGGRRGNVYRDMAWDPKESFAAVADFYAHH